MFDLQVVMELNGQIGFAIDNPAVALTGMAKLTQMVVKNLLTTPGFDPFDPSWGSGLASAMPRLYSRESEEDARSIAGAAIIKCKQDIMSSQTNIQLTPRETLEALDLIDVVYDRIKLRWNIGIRLRSAAGQTVQVGVNTE